MLMEREQERCVPRRVLPPTPANTEPDAELLELAGEYRRLHERVEARLARLGNTDADEKAHDLLRQQCRLEDRIVAIRATTMAV